MGARAPRGGRPSQVVLATCAVWGAAAAPALGASPAHPAPSPPAASSPPAAPSPPAASSPPAAPSPNTPAPGAAGAAPAASTSLPPRASPEADVPPSILPRRVNMLLAPDFGLLHRPAVDSPGGIRYGAAFTFGAHAQLVLASWLRASVYYLHASQSIDAPVGALAPSAGVVFDGSLTSYVIGARLQPTWSVRPNIHLWIDASAGWGVTQTPSAKVGTAPAFTVAARSGVFVELPFGIGGAWDIEPQILSLTVDAMWAPIIGQSGDIDDTAQSIQGGVVVHAMGMPRFAPSFTALAGLALRL